MFKLPPHSLEVGTTYEFRVDVTDSAGYSSSATQVREREALRCPSVHPKFSRTLSVRGYGLIGDRELGDA